MKISKFYLVVASFFAALVFGGCTAYEQAVVANALTGAAYNDPYYYNGYNYGANRDSSYRQGIEDGCNSKQGNYRKNTYQYNNNYSYRNGWNAGYNNCRSNNYNNSYYQNGYSDGCWSRRYPGTRKNSYQYKYNSSYRSGWNKGYSDCRY